MKTMNAGCARCEDVEVENPWELCRRCESDEARDVAVEWLTQLMQADLVDPGIGIDMVLDKILGCGPNLVGSATNVIRKAEFLQQLLGEVSNELGNFLDVDFKQEARDRIDFKARGIAESTFQAIRTLIDYCYTDEERDYAQTSDDQRAGHIFQEIDKIHAWLNM